MNGEKPFHAYFRGLEAMLERIAREQAAAIAEAGARLSAALARGGIVHVFGTGHSHLIAEEAFFRAGGIAGVNPILDERLVFLKGALESTRAEREPGYASELISRERIAAEDIAILISNSGCNWAPVEMALEMKSRGIEIVAITNMTQSSRSSSRHSSRKRLFELADVVIDTCVEPGDALIVLPGLEYPIGASSTVAGAAIMNSIMIEAAANLLERGQAVPVLPSANLSTTTDEDLSKLLRPYTDRIRYLDAV